MASGQRPREEQQTFWVAYDQLPKSGGHPFYEKINELFGAHGFDDWVEKAAAPYYAERAGRPGLAAGIYFRALLVGFFEGLDSERGIAWRCHDSLSLRQFLGVGFSEPPPVHSTLSRTRQRLPLELHAEVFQWVLQVLGEHGVIQGDTIGIDATTLEANAALRSIVRRDTGESYQDFLTKLAKESGIETPTRQDLAKLDRNRPGKGSNDDWGHPHDPDAKITKMKDGRTHLAHKCEHAVDMASGTVVGVTVQGADVGDTTSWWETFAEAATRLNGVKRGGKGDPVKEVVADKGYHSNETMRRLKASGIRSYISEPDRGRRNWKGKPEAREAVYGNRRRIRGNRGRELLRRRGERIERTFAHTLETGGMRRVHLRGHDNILKRMLVQVAGFNLSVLMRRLIGAGTPKALYALFGLLLALFEGASRSLHRLLLAAERLAGPFRARLRAILAVADRAPLSSV